MLGKNVVGEAQTVLREISKSLSTLTVSPPYISVPAQRALYQVSLLKQMLDGEVSFSQYSARIDEFDKRNKAK